MNQPIRSIDSLKRLFDHLEPEFIQQVIAVVWKVIAAVQSFFHPRDHAPSHLQIRKTVGAALS
jgi:hypothetical protein